MPTLCYTRTHGPIYTCACLEALTECNPLNFRRLASFFFKGEHHGADQLITHRIKKVDILSALCARQQNMEHEEISVWMKGNTCWRCDLIQSKWMQRVGWVQQLLPSLIKYPPPTPLWQRSKSISKSHVEAKGNTGYPNTFSTASEIFSSEENQIPHSSLVFGFKVCTDAICSLISSCLKSGWCAVLKVGIVSSQIRPVSSRTTGLWWKVWCLGDQLEAVKQCWFQTVSRLVVREGKEVLSVHGSKQILYRSLAEEQAWVDACGT